MEQIFLRAELFRIGDVSELWDRSVLVKSETVRLPQGRQHSPPLGPISGPDVSSPGHQLATHQAAQSYARHNYFHHSTNNEPEKADKMLRMYHVHGAKADNLQRQGVVATPKHHEDLAVHYHMNSGHYQQSKTPAHSRIGFHLQHAGHPPGTDLDDLAAPHIPATGKVSGPEEVTEPKPLMHFLSSGTREKTTRLKVAKSLIEWDCDLIKARLGAHVSLSESDLNQKLQGGHYSLVSAGRNKEHPDEKNLPDDHPMFADRHEKLRQDLISNGLDHTEVEGHGGGKEKSFLVQHNKQPKSTVPRGMMTKTSFMVHHTDPSEHQIIRDLGKKYNQESVIHSKGGKHECHYTTGESVGTHNKGAGHVIKPEAQDLYTKVEHPKSSTKFELNFDWNKKHPMKDAVLKGLSMLMESFIGLDLMKAKPAILSSVSKDPYELAHKRIAEVIHYGGDHVKASHERLKTLANPHKIAGLYHAAKDYKMHDVARAAHDKLKKDHGVTIRSFPVPEKRIKPHQPKTVRKPKTGTLMPKKSESHKDFTTRAFHHYRMLGRQHNQAWAIAFNTAKKEGLEKALFIYL